MPIPIIGKRSGRPDYSKPIGIDIPTPKAERRVIKQAEYWAAGEITPGPNPGDHIIWAVGKGFAVDQEYVPKNQRFRLYKLTVNVPLYITIKVGVGMQDTKGNITLLYWEMGYQKVTIDFSYLKQFEEETRPVYFIFNYGDERPDFVYWSVIGVVEWLE